MLRKHAAATRGAIIALILTYLCTNSTYINRKYSNFIRSKSGVLLRKIDQLTPPAITRVLQSSPAEAIPIVQPTFPRRKLDALSYRSVSFDEFSIQPSSFTVSR